MSNRCDDCGASLDQPSRCTGPHPRANLAWRIVLAVEREINDRSGIHWEGVNDEVQDEIRETLAGIVQQQLEGKAPYGYCPVCGLPGEARERKLTGNDTCESGHVYPSMEARSR